MKGVGFLLNDSPISPLDHEARDIVIRTTLTIIIIAMTVNEFLWLIQSSLWFYIWLCSLVSPVGPVGFLMDVGGEGGTPGDVLQATNSSYHDQI